MIIENHQISYRNVASKLYNFVPEEIGLAISDFDTILAEHGYNVEGPLFFSIISDPTAEVMTAELFRPIAENRLMVSQEEIKFRSYFSVNPTIMTRIVADFDQQSQMKFWELIEYIEKHEMSQRTPIFVEFKQTHSGKTYMEMSVGVKEAQGK